jgi:hypothetical protein
MYGTMVAFIKKEGSAQNVISLFLQFAYPQNSSIPDEKWLDTF